jgi:CheY-like chemotaxis protein
VATLRLEDPSGSDLTASPRLRLSDLQWRTATRVRKRDGFLEKSDLVFVAENSLKSQKRVLEVEDDPDTREMVSGLLLSEGYEVVSAVHGQDAIEKMEGGFSPDVILLDLMMPVLNGFDVLRVLHRTPRWSSIPVVILSAKEGYDAVDLGTAAIIRKPFDPDVLLNTLRRLLSRAPARIPQ